MSPKRAPFLLGFWLVGTRVFSFLIVALSRYAHSKMGGTPERFSERLGKYRTHEKAEVIWFHAASLGEVMQIGPLASDLFQSEQTDILVTTTTVTGANWVAREMPYASHRFIPIDTPAAVRRYLDKWTFTAAIFIEGDLGPRLVTELHKRNIPQILLNARHSRTRGRFPEVFATLLASFCLITCRSKTVMDDLRKLGLPSDRLYELPDLRLSLPKLRADPSITKALLQTFGVRTVWLAASVHPADDQGVLKAHLEVLHTFPEALLILAPRHPRRGDHLRKLSVSKGLDVAQRSLGECILDSTRVYIADTLGELGGFFSTCPIVFMGGSFGSEGGHNPYEPANFNTALLYGPNVNNFEDAYMALKKAGAATQIQDPAQLGITLVDLMRSDRVETMARAGLDFMEDSQNCLSRYTYLIKAVLENPKGTDKLD